MLDTREFEIVCSNDEDICEQCIARTFSTGANSVHGDVMEGCGTGDIGKGTLVSIHKQNFWSKPRFLGHGNVFAVVRAESADDCIVVLAVVKGEAAEAFLGDV